MSDMDRDPTLPPDPEGTPPTGDDAVADVDGAEADIGATVDATTVADAAYEPVTPEPTDEDRAQAMEAAALARAAAIESSTPPSPEILAAMAAEVEAARPAPRPTLPPAVPVGADGKPIDTTVKPSRRRRAGGMLMRVMTLVIGIALFIGGLTIGYSVYASSRPPAPAVGDPITGGIATPDVVSELTNALASNDADALRSAVTGDPYRLLAGEIQSWGMQGVTSVEILATMQDGTRSATEIVVNGKGTDGQPVTFNLVVHVTDNQIVNFR